MIRLVVVRLVPFSCQVVYPKLSARDTASGEIRVPKEAVVIGILAEGAAIRVCSTIPRGSM
jgi:hypothetical protein